MSRPMFYSIVIPALNLRASLDLVLRCLEAQSFPRDRFECVIVDDGSTDGTRELLESRHSGVKVVAIHHTFSHGRSDARNVGWRQAAGDVLVFLDGDMLPAPGWLAAYDEAFASGELDVVSGHRYCIEVDPKQPHLAERLARLAGNSPEQLFRDNPGRDFERLSAQARFGQYPIAAFEEFDWSLPAICAKHPESVLCAYAFVSSNVAVRRQALERTTGFDTLLRRMEDTDLGVRLWEAGARFGIAERAAAYHQYDPEQPDRGIDYAECMAFLRRHPYDALISVYDWFAARLQRGGGRGESVLELLERRGHESAPGDCRFTTSDLVRYYEQAWAVPPEITTAGLAQAVESGLYVSQSGDKTLFDVWHTNNWLRFKSPFAAELLRRSSFARDHKTPRQQRPDVNLRRSVTYRGVYEISWPTLDERPPDGIALCHIPLPTACAEQSSVRLGRCEPVGLLGGMSADRECVERYTWRGGQAPSRVSYEFECTVHEVAGATRPAASRDEPAAWLRPTLPAAYLSKAKSILRKLRLTPNAPHVETARRIYDWMLEHTALRESDEPDYTVLDTGIGSCVAISRLFINLCRLARVPAKERCGALLLRTTDSPLSPAVEATTLAVSPFSHTWAEIWTGSGWGTVEFIGWVYGRRLLTPLNVQDPHLRQQLVESTTMYDDYYFGSLDPYRIHCGGVANKRPVTVELPSGGHGLLARRLQEGLRHRIVCTLSVVDEQAPAGLKGHGLAGDGMRLCGLS